MVRTFYLLAFLLFVPSALSLANGPLQANGTTPMKYDASRFPLTYQTDLGALGAFSNATATTIADFAFGQWEAIATASVSFTNLGPLDRDVSSPTDPLISGISQFEDGVIPVVFDNDGSITENRIGLGSRQQVYGFAGSISTNGTTYNEGYVIINGFLSGNGNASIEVVFREVITHEIGHMLGLGHSQIGMHADYSLMYPTSTTIDDPTPEADDIAGISLLYPAAGYTASVGSISGKITDSRGAALSGVNVIAIDSATGVAFQSVSDYYSGDDPLFMGEVARTGEYRIDGLPPGKYFVRIEPVSAAYSSGSRVASYMNPINPGVLREWYNGAGESGSALTDDFNQRTGVRVTAGQTAADINIVASDTATLSTLTAYNGTFGITQPLPAPVSNITIDEYAVRYTAPSNGSVLGMKIRLGSGSQMPLNGELIVSVYKNQNGSLAGIPGEKVGSVTVPFAALAADQENVVWLRGIGNGVNFVQGQSFHVAVASNNAGRLDLAFDNGQGTQNQTSFHVAGTGNWYNLAEGLSNGQGLNLLMSAIYTTAPAGTPLPVIGIDPESVDFGKTLVGGEGIKTLTVRNVGSADLQVSNVFFAGTHRDDFSVIAGGHPFTVAPGATRVITVRFSPAATGLRAAQMQIQSNASGSAVTTVPVLGRGSSPAVTELVQSIAFGQKSVGIAHRVDTTVIRNAGTEPLIIDSIRVAGPDGGTAIRLVGNGAGRVVSTNSTLSVKIDFEPAEKRAHNAVLLIYYGLPGSPTEIPITGVGVEGPSGVTTIRSGDLALELATIGPNPARESFDVVLGVSGAGRETATLLVSDGAGRILVRETSQIVGAGAAWEKRWRIDAARFASGTYYVTIRTSAGTLVRKLSVVR